MNVRVIKYISKEVIIKVIKCLSIIVVRMSKHRHHKYLSRHCHETLLDSTVSSITKCQLNYQSNCMRNDETNQRQNQRLSQCQCQHQNQ